MNSTAKEMRMSHPITSCERRLRFLRRIDFVWSLCCASAIPLAIMTAVFFVEGFVTSFQIFLGLLAACCMIIVTGLAINIRQKLYRMSTEAINECDRDLSDQADVAMAKQ